MNKITPNEVEQFLATSVFNLVASQTAISFPIIERIHRRLQQGHKFNSIKVMDGIIIDGHHRYICLNMLGMDIESIKAGRNSFIVKTIQWTAMNVDHKDYDTLQEIKAYEEKYD